jgi:two-component system, chemotaxis family, CheB/CheR fusion protein
MDQARQSDKSDGGRSPPAATDFPVVGIGVTSDAVDTMTRLLREVDAASGVAVVVVPHVAPERSLELAGLVDAIGPRGEIARDGAQLAPGRVLVVPADVVASVEGDHLHLEAPSAARQRHHPIDSFLCSLAKARGPQAAGVILAGAGSDGTLGLRAMKEQGGITLAQSDVPYDGMMRAALTNGLVDFALPPEQIGVRLVDHFAHLAQFASAHDAATRQQETAEHLHQICAVLRARTGHDFGGYKDNTVVRRVLRRMQILKLDRVEDFIARLKQDAHEVELFFQDLLIGVTQFFRDPQAFAALEQQVIPALFAGKGTNDAVRVWVPGCATGEEAYSIAILLSEHLRRAGAGARLQIFASDIDARALEIGRVGRYPAATAIDIPSERLARYFTREDGTYRIVPELRECCVFARHDLLRDAPFSRLDLISCRNLLIYFDAELQNRVIPLFHYALRPGGHLFLGSAENVSRHARLFAPVDKQYRIFQRRQHAGRTLPEFPLSAAIPMGTRVARDPATTLRSESLPALAERLVLQRFAPAFVVINGDGEVLHASGRTGRFLELPAGTPRLDVFSMARPGLRPHLRAALHKAASSTQPVLETGLRVEGEGDAASIDLFVQPLDAAVAHEPVFVVVFRDAGDTGGVADAQALAHAADGDGSYARQLENELAQTRERLQNLTEELESSNEELRSGNEELSSMNEELQSANEELETSKEELQSINEELQTVNAELHARVEELSRAHNDVANLLESTQIATLFLDGSLRVRSFTPRARDLFYLVESDAGRPIIHVRTRFRHDTVQEDARHVLETGDAIEREVEGTDSSDRYIMRLLPYRSGGSAVGVVITFVDVTRITAAETRINELSRSLRDRLESLQGLLDLVPVGILIIEQGQATHVQVNRYCARLVGEETAGTGLRALQAPLPLVADGVDLAEEAQPLQRVAQSGAPIEDFEGQLRRADGRLVDVMITAAPLFDEEGKIRGAIAAMVDISQRRQAELHQRGLLHELQHRVKNTMATVVSLARRMLQDSRSLEEFAEPFIGRLRAMAAMHAVLSDHDWQGATLRGLVEAAVTCQSSTQGAQLGLDGPDVLLPPNAVGTLGMAIYELATNAAKYGALSTTAGRVDVAWRLDRRDGRDVVVLDWIESGGPRVEAPATAGFGAAFLKRSVEYELEGLARLDYPPEGVRCTLTFPLPSGTPGPGASRPEDHSDGARPASAGGTARDDRRGHASPR